MAKRRIPISVKRMVRLRANGFCEYCQCHDFIATETFPVDHVESESEGGTDDLENLAYACSNCNGSKHKKTVGIDPLTEKLVPLFHPRKHKWREHFAWSEDFLEIVGLTPIGRTTVCTLKVNREQSIRRRAILYKLGMHPPLHTLLG